MTYMFTSLGAFGLADSGVHPWVIVQLPSTGRKRRGPNFGGDLIQQVDKGFYNYKRLPPN